MNDVDKTISGSVGEKISQVLPMGLLLFILSGRISFFLTQYLDIFTLPSPLPFLPPQYTNPIMKTLNIFILLISPLLYLVISSDVLKMDF